MAALISRLVNVPITGAHRAWCPTQSRPRPHPSRPALRSAVGQHHGGTWENLPTFWFLSSSSFFFLILNTCHLSAENLSLTTSASCIPLFYSLPIVHFVTVWFTLDHLLSHSHSPTSIKSLSHCSVSLVGCLPLAGKQLFLSALPTLCLFTGSSSCSLTPPRWRLFILLLCSIPLSSPLIQAHSRSLSTLLAALTGMIIAPTTTTAPPTHLYFSSFSNPMPPLADWTICIL